MRHLTRDDVDARRVLRAARAIAVIEPAARRGDRAVATVTYLKDAGFDVFPVRADRAEVAGLPAYARLADVPGSVDVVLVFRDAESLVEEAAAKRARAVWLPRGVVVRDAARRAARAAVALVRDRDIVEDHRRGEQVPGEPAKLAAAPRRRGRPLIDDRIRESADGYREAGGGGGRGGGGKRTALDEKKMLGGRPSPRRG